MAEQRSALYEPQIVRVLLAYGLARIPAAAVWLSIVLDVSAATGSYGKAGVAVGAYGLGVAVVAPVMGRAADRRGARTVLLLCTAVQLPALLLLAAAADGEGLALLVPAFVAGAVQPPLVPCMRASWAQLVPDPQRRQACFAFDAVLGEVVDLGAPLIAVALNIARGDSGSLTVVAIAVALTTVLYVVVAPTGRQDPQPVRPPGRVTTRPVLSVLLIVLLLTAGLGAVEVGAVALADGLGDRSATGLLLGLFTAGSIVGGVVFGRMRWRIDGGLQLLLLLVPLEVGLLAASVAPQEVWVTGPLLLLSGCTVAPLVTVLLGMLQAAAREGAVTETFTYATTANFVGVAGGSAIAGAVVDAGAAGMLVAASLVGAAAFAVAVVRGLLPTPVPLDDDDEDLPAVTPGPRGLESVASGVPAPRREQLVEELEAAWSEAREAGRRNDELARRLAAHRLADDRRALLAAEVAELEAEHAALLAVPGPGAVPPLPTQPDRTRT